MHCMYDISACGLLRRLRSKSTDATDASPASTAMDPVPEEPTPSQGEVTSKGTEGKDAVAAPAGDAAVPKAPGAAPAVPTAPLLQSGMPAVNSSNYRKEYCVEACVRGPTRSFVSECSKSFFRHEARTARCAQEFPAARWQFGSCGSFCMRFPNTER